MSRASHHTAHAGTHHLARWQRASLYTVGTVLLLTGLAWCGVHYLIGAGAGELPHPSEPWLMRLHGLAASAGLFVLGLVAAEHVPHGWRLSRRPRWAHQRRTGLALCVLGASLALTGYLLYYFAPETVRPALGWTHLALGVLMALAIGLHRRSAGQAAPPSHASSHPQGRHQGRA